jgi:hypothetical protein
MEAGCRGTSEELAAGLERIGGALAALAAR